MASLSVVLPAFNEEENIGPMIGDVLATAGGLAGDLEIVVVDDGSRDRTAELVRAAGETHPEIRLVQHETNRGYGAAVLTGLMAATRDLVFFTDADRQFDLAEVKGLLAAIGHADLVVGERSPRRDPLMRRLNGAGWSGLVNLLFGYTARDIDCAFKLMRREVITAVGPQVGARGATFSAEFLVRARRAGYRIREVELKGHHPRVAGRATGARPAVILRAFAELLRLRWQLWFEPATGRELSGLSRPAGPRGPR